jgi:autotransporter-associated beta strand protein
VRSGARLGIENVNSLGNGVVRVDAGGGVYIAVGAGNTVTNDFEIAGLGWREGAGELGAIRIITGNVSGDITLLGDARLGAWTNQGGTISGVISDGGNGFGIEKFGGGEITLTATNTYTGATILRGGTLNVGTLADGGVASSIGQSSNAAANLVFAGGTLAYSGADVTIDRNFQFANGSNNTISVVNAGTTLTLTGASPSSSGALIKQRCR